MIFKQKNALDAQFEVVEKVQVRSIFVPFKAVKAHRHLLIVREAAKNIRKLLEEMLKESRVHLEPLSEKVQKIRHRS